ncbi:MAG: hypothetical protein N3A58_06515, partial [Spirochaetes bacterium]|nr:hypothetical protein [Spirochaetota bacterium]
MENALPKKKLKIYLKPFSIYKNIVYLKNSFHHLTPKDFFIYNKIILSKLKLFEYQNDPEKFNKYIDKLFIKYFNDFYKFNFKNILFFSNFKLFNFF